MTTDPEQADTVPPQDQAFRSEMGRLKDALEEGAVVSLDEWVQIAVALGGRVDWLEEELRKERELLSGIDRSAERAWTELEEARRQARDWENACRVTGEEGSESIAELKADLREARREREAE